MIELPDTCITSVNTAVDTDTNTTQQEAGELFSSTFINDTHHFGALETWSFWPDRDDA